MTDCGLEKGEKVLAGRKGLRECCLQRIYESVACKRDEKALAGKMVRALARTELRECGLDSGIKERESAGWKMG